MAGFDCLYATRTIRTRRCLKTLRPCQSRFNPQKRGVNAATGLTMDQICPRQASPWTAARATMIGSTIFFVDAHLPSAKHPATETPRSFWGIGPTADRVPLPLVSASVVSTKYHPYSLLLILEGLNLLQLRPWWNSDNVPDRTRVVRDPLCCSFCGGLAVVSLAIGKSPRR